MSTTPAEAATPRSARPAEATLLSRLTAVHRATEGEEPDELVPILAERDPAGPVPIITRMTPAEAGAARAFFTAYGCCTVTDPIGELADLGLLEKE